MIRPAPIGGWAFRWVAAFVFVYIIFLGALVVVDALA